MTSIVKPVWKEEEDRKMALELAIVMESSLEQEEIDWRIARFLAIELEKEDRKTALDLAKEQEEEDRKMALDLAIELEKEVEKEQEKKRLEKFWPHGFCV